MNLQQPGQVWNRLHEVQRNEEIRRADRENHKRGQDIEVGEARLILTSPNGARWSVTVSNLGVLSATAI